MQKNNAYIITGAPGAGKTTVIQALEKEGIVCIEEPARQIIEEQRLIDGNGLYDKDAALFVQLMLSRMIYQYQQISSQDIVIFDRGIPDMMAYSECFNLPIDAVLAAAKYYRYNVKVFFAPCWEDIFVNDGDRQLTFQQALAFEKDLRLAYEKTNYEIIDLPLVDVASRVKFMLNHIDNQSSSKK